MHPLTGDLTGLKDSEIETKIQMLTKNFFVTHNIDLRTQISSLLEDYNAELTRRRNEQLKKMMDSRDKSLDKLIKID